MRLTAKERVLLHLLDYVKYREALEVPAEMTQDGIASAAWVELRHLGQYLHPLLDEESVRERTCHVKGIRQRRKVYDLTDAGQHAAYRLRERVRAETVRVRDGQELREETVAQVVDSLGGKLSLLEAVRRCMEAGSIDLAGLRAAPRSSFVEMIAEAPRLDRFVGRQAELRAIAQEDGGSRIFVVRGVAGIGKSSFGAKACELQKGTRNLFWHRIRPWETEQVILASLGAFLSAMDRPGLTSVLARGEMTRALEILRQDLAGTRSFLVFDDAQEASEAARVVFQVLADAVSAAPDVRVLILTRQALHFYSRRAVVVEGLVHEIELLGLDPNEAATVLGEREGSPVLAGLGRGMAGHPLFLDLVRTHGPSAKTAMQDVHRFIEEEVYIGLSDAERAIMGGGSLYRVPVPRDALLAIPGASYEALVSLQDHALLRHVGDERYEIHDTIRAFFARTLTPRERRAFGEAAVAELRSLADKARLSADLVGCIACLSNAVRIAKSPVERAALNESLGDASERLGDMSGVSAGYRGAMELVQSPEALVRLHRKLAMALEDDDRVEAASAEVEAGFAALGDAASVERGWLDLVRARITADNNDFAAGERYAESARRLFEEFGDRRGQALALLDLGNNASWTATTTEGGEMLARRCYERALELATELDDPLLEARIHLGVTTSLGYAGEYEEGMKHLRAVESSPVAMADLHTRAILHLRRAWLVARLRGEVPGVEADRAEADKLAQKVHDSAIHAGVLASRGQAAGAQGHHDESARMFEEAAAEWAREGSEGGAAITYIYASDQYLVAGDWDGYRRAEGALHMPRIARGLEAYGIVAIAHCGLDALISGDLDGFESTFAEVFRRAEAIPEKSQYRTVDLWNCHLYYSVALRVLGRRGEADEHLARAEQLARAVGALRPLRILQGDFGDRMVETIRRNMKPV